MGLNVCRLLSRNRENSEDNSQPGPSDDENSPSFSLQNPFDVENSSDYLSTHLTNIKITTENSENSQIEVNLKDDIRWLYEETNGNTELTDNEIQLRKDSTFRLLNKAIESIHHIVSSEHEEEKMKEELWEHFKAIQLVRLAFEKFGPLPVEVINEYRRKAGQQLSVTKSICVLCKMIKTGWQMCSIKEESPAVKQSSRLTWAAFGILWEFSYWSFEIANDIVADSDFLKTLLDILTSYRDKRVHGEKMNKIESHMVDGSLSIIRNLSIVDGNITPLREHGILVTLRPYLDSKTLSDRLCAYFSLANLIGEAESEIIHGHNDLLKVILETLETTLQDKRHKCMVASRTFFARDCALTIHRLIRNNINKTLLVDMGCLSPLVQLAMIGTVEETREAMGAIWFLALDKYNQEKMLEDKKLNIVDLMTEIRKISGDKTIKETADATLRLLRGELQENQDEVEMSSDDFANKNRCTCCDRGIYFKHESLSQEEKEFSSSDYIDKSTTGLENKPENQMTSKADVEGTPSDVELLMLSRTLDQHREEWWILIKLLGLSDEIIDKMENGEGPNARKYYKMLTAWRKQNAGHEKGSIGYLLSQCDEAGIDRHVTMDIFKK